MIDLRVVGGHRGALAALPHTAAEAVAAGAPGLPTVLGAIDAPVEGGAVAGGGRHGAVDHLRSAGADREALRRVVRQPGGAGLPGAAFVPTPEHALVRCHQYVTAVGSYLQVTDEGLGGQLTGRRDPSPGLAAIVTAVDSALSVLAPARATDRSGVRSSRAPRRQPS